VWREGALSNSMWHSDWKQSRDDRRSIAEYGVFGRAASASAVLVLRRRQGNTASPSLS